MNDIVLIQRRIYEFRGRKVILDRDLASLYGVETKALNQAVKRNLGRFPEDFMFQLSQSEYREWKSQNTPSNFIENEPVEPLRSQIVTSNSVKMTRFRPYAFTEHGVVMMASLLHSETAISMSVQITRAFIAMRQTIATLASTEAKIELLNEKVEKLNMYVEEVLRDQNDFNEETSMQLELINQSLAELQAKPQPKPRRRIGFNADDDTDK